MFNVFCTRGKNLTSASGLIVIGLMWLLFSQSSFGQVASVGFTGSNDTEATVDSLKSTERPGKFIHEFGLEYRAAQVILSTPFYRTDYTPQLNLGPSRSAHLKYAFSLPESALGGKAYPRTFQGIGLAFFDFGNTKQVGTPLAAYLFQRSEIAKISQIFSVDYEWNFGLSSGWVPYDPQSNPDNIIVGSTANAYINLGGSLRWQIAKRLAMTAGVEFTHFSNGNTEYPNAGVNTSGIKLGLLYDVSKSENYLAKAAPSKPLPFPRHVSYDLVVFGSSRRKGVDFFGAQVASPYKYPVLGAYFAPMYNWNYRLRTGISLDVLYDGSANVYTEDYIVGTEQQFFRPSWDRQAALGVSSRLDYVMPFFTLGIGIGANFLHKGGDLRGTYQTFALKIRTTRSSFIHIGYNLKDFHDPNYLMLGVGFRFNNGEPSLLSR